ncbi:MAG: hypothetical protein JWN13_3818 [Betaproteobacteria bacterium]|jgi:hypothetical protein|nr:hypothetical protein [Betaproteobacteria bacterium]
MESGTNRRFGLRVFLSVWKTPRSTALPRNRATRLNSDGLRQLRGVGLPSSSGLSMR